MKIEFEINDIKREEVIEAAAQSLLNDRECDEDGNDLGYSRNSVAKQLTAKLDKKLDALAEKMVRENFDVIIKERIAAKIKVFARQGETFANGGTAMYLKQYVDRMVAAKDGAT